ncbi:diguanylate cyclase domain-containing protein [Clostridium pasteurianum]|uniref:PAS domain S-box/diguanylate cyclase (GGDEF) domain-containing protein n=1 Tax=Clostridium pasteurianum BC1 TaxID=86416 RepID=R4JZD3_CLOPA|nr:diguanylate cyclase [Clostridium pasteurianum]AGK96187.1 PAS domain S-box/diguanylate cyclase (GGDEF) domain-containing protein [Clostridium pasteurianum BC1]
MYFLSLLSLICSIIYLYIGVNIFRLKKDSILTRLFILSCVGMFIWSSSYGLFYITADNTQIVFSKIASLGWCFCPALLLHLCLIFTKNKFSKKRILAYAIYIPGSIFFFIRLFLIGSDTSTSPILLNLFYKFNFIYNLTFTSACYLLLFISYKKSITIKEKKQTRMIILTGTFSYISNIAMQYTLSIYGLKNIPQIDQILNIVIFLGIYYSIINYSLFEISPNLIINNLISQMLGVVIIISPAGEILNINKFMEKLTGYKADSLIGKSIYELIDSKDILDSISKNNYDTGNYIEINCKTKNNEIIPMNISPFPIVNKKINEISGILLVGYDIKNIKKLQQEVEDHRKNEEELKESEEKFKIMFYKHTSIMCLFDPETLRILDVNDAAIKFYGYSYEQLKNMKITEVSKLKEDSLRNIINKIIYSNDTTPYKTKHILSDCNLRDVEIHATPITFKNKKIIFSIINDITERNKNDEHISFLAYHDSLTGLPNRKLFYLKLEQTLYQAQLNNAVFAVLYIDFDGFKAINDTYGHQIGDFVLRTSSQKLKHCIRKEDTLARIGGDEFTILLNDIQNYENAQLVVKKLLSILNDPIIINNHKLFINASIGISLYPLNGDTIDSLIQNADHHMYTIKRQKKKIL